ncbi:MAG: hypothetical protein HY820_15525 [Acidobacteria bacterium]|nr:hypothetical protein [Acidobacteriota bacterium]
MRQELPAGFSRLPRFSSRFLTPFREKFIYYRTAWPLVLLKPLLQTLQNSFPGLHAQPTILHTYHEIGILGEAEFAPHL